MKIVSWNISWAFQKEKILECLMGELGTMSTIVCLQEVTPSVCGFFREQLDGKELGFVYSLDYRFPGAYDSKSRKLGVLIITSKDVEIIRAGILPRVPYPDRTAFVRFKYCNSYYTIVSLHSVTGVNYKKGKSVQFDSFAEAIAAIQPDIVTFDANEPKVDHYDIAKMQFFNNGDKGAGAKRFFTALRNCGLTDAYSLFFDKGSYVEGLPLTTSHILSTEERRRYDFIFVNDERIDLRGCQYHYDEAIAATAGHAYIVTYSDMELKAAKEAGAELFMRNVDKDYTEADLLPFCRHYDPSKPQDKQDLLGYYELTWMQIMMSDKAYITELITDYICCNLETFNLGDGVPLSLKALLFNRYAHWESYATVEGFKEWYLKYYVGKKGCKKKPK